MNEKTCRDCKHYHITGNTQGYKATCDLNHDYMVVCEDFVDRLDYVFRKIILSGKLRED